MANPTYYDDDDAPLLQRAVVCMPQRRPRILLTRSAPCSRASPSLDFSLCHQSIPVHHPLPDHINHPPHAVLHSLRLLLLQLHPPNWARAHTILAVQPQRIITPSCDSLARHGLDLAASIRCGLDPRHAAHTSQSGGWKLHARPEIASSQGCSRSSVELVEQYHNARCSLSFATTGHPTICIAYIVAQPHNPTLALASAQSERSGPLASGHSTF